MTTQEIINKCTEFKELKRMEEELQALMEAIKDEIKNLMVETNQEKLIAGQYKISYTDRQRNDLNKKRLEETLGDLTSYMDTKVYKCLLIS